MEIIPLRYGNTRTYFVGGLLIDTDMAGTLPAFRRELKRHGLTQDDVRWVLATHYHPDHIGLIGELTRSGVTLLLAEHQKPFVHFSDAIYARMPGCGFLPIDGERAAVIPCGGSRAFLSALGVSGEIVPTASHSADGAALILDDGNAFVGDLEPSEYLAGYGDHPALREDWDRILRLGARIIHSAHRPDLIL